jgi:malonyl-CoA O-methyltransferase
MLCSTFGPDTLLELRQAFDNTRVHSFIDMHDLGSLLMQTGFVDPVLDSEWHIRYYPGIEDLYWELKGLGAMSVLPGKSGLGGRALLQKAKANYEMLRTPEGLPSTYEVIFAQAWVGPSKNHAAESTIPLDQLQRLGNQKAVQSEKTRSI